MIDNPFHLHELVTVRDPNLTGWLDLYESAFPPHERGLVSWHISALLAREDGRPTRSRLWALLDSNGGFTGMAQTTWNASVRLAYLGYFAILPEARGQGAGSAFYRLLLPEVQQADFLLFDVECPQGMNGAERENAERRIRFYERLGAALLPGVTMYWQQARQRMMAHPFVEIEVQEIIRRAGALLATYGAELRRDSEG